MNLVKTRMMLELSWEALENAGISPSGNLRIGVFAGCSNPGYLIFNIVDHDAGWFGSPDYVESLIATDRDYLSTRVSYKLGLEGPSVNIQTACSTSLVAVHLACQSLLLGECDVALAGGIALQVPHNTGYLWQPGGTRHVTGSVDRSMSRQMARCLGVEVVWWCYAVWSRR